MMNTEKGKNMSSEKSSARETHSIKWLGFNSASNYNQIWGHVLMADARVFSFWGKKGGRILFKKHNHVHQLNWLAAQKESKGFKKIDPDHYELICPGFREEFEIWLTSAILADDF